MSTDTGVRRLRRGRQTGVPSPSTRAAVAEMLRVCRRAADGDLEARVTFVPGTEDDEQLIALRHELNRVLDRTDAFVREAAASLESASEGKFYREFLLDGMPGSLRRSARTINTARVAMEDAAGAAAANSRARMELADEFEGTVLAVAEQVAAAATELSASAASLSASARAAVHEADSARTTVGRLDATSREIQQVVTLISQVAGQTRLLALNATIEAARAGEAGRGFAVVATEVKQLADKTSGATGEIVTQVDSVTSVAEQSTAVMDNIGSTIREMDSLVEGIAVAVDGGTGGGDGDLAARGLSQMAELLRVEVLRFLDVMRAG